MQDQAQAPSSIEQRAQQCRVTKKRLVAAEREQKTAKSEHDEALRLLFEAVDHSNRIRSAPP